MSKSYGVIRSLLGFAEVSISAASPAVFLNECARLGLPFWDVEKRDECSLRLTLRQSDAGRARTAAERCGCEFTLEKKCGGTETLRRVRRQLSLCVGALLVLVLLFVSMYINSILYDGNSNINFMYVASPPMSGLPYLNENQGWLVYILRYALLVLVCVTGCYGKVIWNTVRSKRSKSA